MPRKTQAQAQAHPRSPANLGGMLGRLLRDRRGSAAVEFAVALPALATMLLGAMEFGRLLWTQNALHYAVEEAARCHSVNSSVCGSASQTQSFAASRAGLTFANATFTVTTASCGNQVSARYPFAFVVPLFDYQVTLQAQSCYPT